ncbi:MAG: hypothetical protein CMC96_09780 [Flavobacteriales bacterium]|nr:hypothetical protein [Flavobacteriales bacterium]|tara:strand:+ start:50637 stop:51344 length:708 start_codon:yes stop_codon:yes gene_type:complete
MRGINQYQEVLEFINPPTQITSIGQMRIIIDENKHLTMIEKSFFHDLFSLVVKIVEQDVSGDVVLIGVYKGGMALYLKSLLECLGVYKKFVLIDSFDGFNSDYLNNEDISSINNFTENGKFRNQPTVDGVYSLFKSFKLEKNVQIVKSYIENIESVDKLVSSVALLHIDVDVYGATYSSLFKFTPLLSSSAVVIVDDYYVPVFSCRKAVDNFLKDFSIKVNPKKIGKYACFWNNY